MIITFALSLAACSSSRTHEPARAELDLPGDTFYPQAIHASADGTIFVGGLVNAPIVKFAPGSVHAEVIVPAQPPYAFPALYADDSTKTLYACRGMFDGPGWTNPEAELRAYDYGGNLVKAYPVPRGSLCEEIAIDAQHRIYVADSYRGNIFVLANGAEEMKPWLSGSELAPIPPPAGAAFGVHSLAFDGESHLYFDNFDQQTLGRILINEDGSAGPVEMIAPDVPLRHPEGLRAIDKDTLVLTEDLFDQPMNGRLVRLSLGAGATATTTVLASDLEGPTNVVPVQGSFWVTEGQITHLLDRNAGAPNLPFRARRVAQGS